LADRVPESTILYFGWRGGEDPGPGYGASPLKALVDESNLHRVFSQMVPAAIRRIAREEPEAEEPLKIAYAFATQAWRKPMALTVGAMDYENFDDPFPRIALITQAGADAPALAQQISDLLTEVPDDVPVNVIAQGDLVVLTFGYIDPATAVVAGEGLGASGSFRNALEKPPPDPTLALYIDVGRLIAEIDRAVFTFGGNDAADTPVDYYQRVRDALGIKGVHRILFTSGFESKLWSDRAYVQAPAPRTGIVAVADGKPLDKQLLRVVPRSSHSVLAGRFDAAKLIAQLRLIANEVDPEFGQMFDQGMGAANLAIGRNLETDILEPLGEHWIAFTAPEIAGNSLLGTVVINKLDDPAKAQQGFTALSLFISNSANTFLRRERAPIELPGRTVTFGDIRVWTIALPLISPCWAIDGEYIYFAFYPQAIVGAINHVRAGGPSVLENPAFVQVMEQLGNREVDGLTFTNLPAFAPDGYTGLLALSRGLLGIGDLFGVPAPEPVVPLFATFEKNVTPMGSISWSDDSGFYYRAISPFPGASILRGGVMDAFGLLAPFSGFAPRAIGR
ncbi:MAG TPA: hypothetical protein PKB10_08145, partial [Tepidisphaeraceae bacterium]|nr:hypothetical protein [Tepidisphaeraceae bacterium]